MKLMPITAEVFDTLIEDGANLDVYFDETTVFEGSEDDLIKMCLEMQEGVEKEHQQVRAHVLAEEISNRPAMLTHWSSRYAEDILRTGRETTALAEPFTLFLAGSDPHERTSWFARPMNPKVAGGVYAAFSPSKATVAPAYNNPPASGAKAKSSRRRAAPEVPES